MRLYSFYASQIDFLKNDCVKLLVFNAEHRLYKEDLDKFIDKLLDMVDLFTDKEIDSYFAKR